MKDVRIIKLKMDTWGIKQKWLADRLGVNTANLSYWLSGTVDMPPDKVKQAKEILRKLPVNSE